jgi:hypothetical protein
MYSTDICEYCKYVWKVSGFGKYLAEFSSKSLWVYALVFTYTIID